MLMIWSQPSSETDESFKEINDEIARASSTQTSYTIVTTSDSHPSANTSDTLAIPKRIYSCTAFPVGAKISAQICPSRLLLNHAMAKSSLVPSSPNLGVLGRSEQKWHSSHIILLLQRTSFPLPSYNNPTSNR
jgi:hypothetical protein